ALITKLYLNAEVFNGTAEWNKVIEHADNIINSGLYNLEPDFFANFSQSNEGSTENIFVIVYDPVFSGGMQIGVRTLHYGHQAGWEFANQPWNGFASLQEFYDKFDDTDPRKESFVAGPQFGFDGSEVIDDTPGAGDDTPQVIFSTSIRALDDARREDGVRIGKFELFVRGADPANGNNDFPIFRLGDIILSKAEAQMRLGQNADALMLVNMIRQRAGMPDLTSLTLDELLDERAREVAFEGYRRQDLIRFGKFQDAWEFKPAGSSDHTNLFPISETQLNANSNLQQNPGYPGRGGG
ncbi:MAG: RagB/SusD family nutrient uptake outer membrane protein, partial [Aurantibacter sp.]